MTDIQWASPPPRGSGPGSAPSVFTDRLADALRARPGEWAVLKEYERPQSALNASALLRHGRTRWGAGFESVCRGSVVYVRYVGEAQS